MVASITEEVPFRSLTWEQDRARLTRMSDQERITFVLTLIKCSNEQYARNIVKHIELSVRGIKNIYSCAVRYNANATALICHRILIREVIDTGNTDPFHERFALRLGLEEIYPVYQMNPYPERQVSPYCLPGYYAVDGLTAHDFPTLFQFIIERGNFALLALFIMKIRVTPKYLIPLIQTLKVGGHFDRLLAFYHPRLARTLIDVAKKPVKVIAAMDQVLASEEIAPRQFWSTTMIDSLKAGAEKTTQCLLKRVTPLDPVAIGLAIFLCSDQQMERDRSLESSERSDSQMLKLMGRLADRPAVVADPEDLEPEWQWLSGFSRYRRDPALKKLARLIEDITGQTHLSRRGRQCLAQCLGFIKSLGHRKERVEEVGLQPIDSYVPLEGLEEVRV